MEIHWNKLKTLKTTADRVGRGIAVLGLVSLAFGPAVTPTQAGVEPQEWADLRPPRTDTNIASTTAAGYTYLVSFGSTLALDTAAVALYHSLAVGPNGDLFAGGKVATGTAPSVFKSSDGGMTWEDSPAFGCTGAKIVGIAVSPKYPSDNSVYAAVSDGAAGTAGCEGVFQSGDGGKTFTVFASDAAAAPGCAAFTTACVDFDAGVAAGNLTSIAIAPDFDRSNNAGEIAVGVFGGPATGSVYRLRPGSSGTWTATTFVEPAFASSTLAVCYSQYRDDYVLGRVVAGAAIGVGGTAATLGQTATAGTFPAVADNGPNTIVGAAAGTTSASCAWPQSTSGPGSGVGWYLGITGAAGTTNNVYKRSSGAWDNKDACGALANCPVAEVAVQGFGADANVLATQFSAAAGATNVYRSTNGGSTWNAKNVDSSDTVVQLTGGRLTLAMHPGYITNGTAYLSVPEAKGSILKTTNKASSWAETGLSNVATLAQSVSIASDSTWFIRQRVAGIGGGSALNSCDGFICEWYKTTNMGDSSPYQRVVRSTGAQFDFEEMDRSPTFATDGIVYLTRRGKATPRMIKSTDGGVSWKTLTTDPGDTVNEQVTVVVPASASQLYVGTDEGKVLWTADGGSTWVQSNTDVGNRVFDIDLSPAFATDNTLFVTALSTANAYEVWRSTDGGTTFTQVGTSSGAWGSGGPFAGTTPVLLTLAAGYATNKMAYLMPRGSGDQDIFRMKTDGTANWEGLGTASGDQPFGVIQVANAAGVGDGEVLYAASVTAATVVRTFFPQTSTKANYNDNRLVSRTTFGDGATVATTGMTGFRTHALGRQWWAVAGGRIVNMLEIAGQPTPVAPLNNSNVPTNSGQDGVPLTLTWQNVDRARAWDVQISLDPDFKQFIVDPTSTGDAFGTPCQTAGGAAIAGCVVNPSGTVTAGTGALNSATSMIAALVQGNTYYWRVRVRRVGQTSAVAATHAGAWSAARKFSVAPPAGAVSTPQPSLPLNGSSLPGVGTQLSWNNPAGTTQIQIQVTPLNNDGPGVNLIFGSPIQSYDVPPPVFGTGPYVMLPGATYTWRLRAANAVTAIGETDSSWGPWSDPRTFTAALPNAGTIQQVGPINGASTTDTTPTLSWKDGNSAMFYYEVQLSSDKNFGDAGAVAPVFHNLIHGGVSKPENSWTVPDANALAKGAYYWRIRQRVQATAKGGTETGIAWSPAQTFVVG